MNSDQSIVNWRRRIQGSLRYRQIAIGGAAWLICIVIGFWTLLVHDTESTSTAGHVEAAWVTHASLSNHIDREELRDLTPDAGELHIVMALHPKCPCTHNTMRELARLVSIDPLGTRCTFLVHLPATKSLSWMDTETTQMARELPNTQLIVDRESSRAKRLGLNRSGEAMVITHDGKVSFRGGITAGRSCLMENPGARAIENLVHRIAISPLTTPTFGCPLQYPTKE